jgi:hypothetical protein
MTDNEDIPVTVRGIVIPAIWNESGVVLGVAIAAYNEEKYMVADTPMGQKLMAYLRTPVTVDGVVKSEGSSHSIEVNAFWIDGQQSPE